jgi:pyruvate dehydrogenase E2 component (dihydrolipoamide acetyltransferase)
MARWEFKLPDIGEGVTEGEIVKWLVTPGQSVTEDQPMVEVMTDKATVTITAPRAGTVVETRGQPGEIIKVHSVLLVFELAGAAASPNAPPHLAQTEASQGTQTNGHTRDGARGARDASDDGPAATAVGDIKESLPGMGALSAGAVHGYYNEKPLATPATRKLARDMNVDLRQVPPTGPQGRVTKRDVEGFSHGATPSATATTPAKTGRLAGSAASPQVVVAVGSAAQGGAETRVPLAGLRRRIAQRMAQSTRTASHFTFVEECDVSALKAVRGRLKSAGEAMGVKLSFLPLIVKAVVAALKKHPMLNASLDEAKNEIVLHNHFHIGIATATEAGLIVPVVKNADRRTIVDIAREIDRLAEDARAGKSKLEDVQGSTFTITSLGAQGGLFATPIINYPEVAILGVHQMKQKPVVRNGQIAIGDVMLLSLSFDHRVVDGHVGAAFAYDVIRYLEEPDLLMLEMT